MENLIKELQEKNGWWVDEEFLENNKDFLEQLISTAKSKVLVEANHYQKLAARTLLEKPDFEISPEQVMIAWNAIGLSGEAGEVADLIKKGIFHQQGLKKEELKKELGDTLWYLSALCTLLGFSLSEIMDGNIEKLKARFPEGYSPERTNFKTGKAK